MGFIKPNNNSGGSGGGLTPQELSRLNNAYTHSKSEHAPTTAEQNVQPDWNETDTTSDAYIKNKPDLSQVGSGEVDLSGYVTKETGNANQITFADGQTFQAKLDAGTLKGDKGDSGGSNINDTTASATTTYSSNKIENIKKDLNSQIKDIANLSLVKHTDGKVYIKKQDGTLLGTGVEVGSNTDLSKITMSMEGQTLKLLNNGTQIATVEIPTATVTDEQLTNIIQAKIDDGSISSIVLGDNAVATANIQNEAVTPNKTNFFSEEQLILQDITFTRMYGASPGYFGGKGSCGTQLLDITNVNKIYARSKSGMPLVWIRYALNDDTSNLTYVSTESGYGSMVGKDVEFNYFWGVTGIDDHATYPCFTELDLTYWKSIGVTHISLGFKQVDGSVNLVNVEDVKISFVSSDIADCGLSDIMFQVDDNYKDKIHLNKQTLEDMVTTPRPQLFNMNKTINTNFNTSLSNRFGANNLILYYGYIDVSVQKTIYAKHYCSNKIGSQWCGMVFACFDENKDFLYLSNNDTAVTAGVNYYNVSNIYDINGLETLPDGTVVYNKGIGYITFPDAVKYVVATNSLDGEPQKVIRGDTFVLSFDEITDYNIKNSDVLVKEDFKNIVQDIAGSTDEIVTKGVFIGDSLTNWGGGNDTSGFLGIVHNKTGMLTSNRGLAGATWQQVDGQTQSGVTRVNTIVDDGLKFDLYCFILGTNGGSITDTGETSSDTTTMCGAIRYCLETLKKFDPTGTILVCLPPQRAEGNENQLLVNEVIKKIAEDEYSVRTLDLYRHSGVVPNTTIANINYLSDGLHLGDNGKTVLGNLLASEIKYLLCL